MRVVIQGKEVEIEEVVEEGAREMDFLEIGEMKDINLDDTIEVSEELLERIQEESYES